MSFFTFIIGYIFFSIPNPLYLVFLIYFSFKWFFKSSDTELNHNYDDIQLTNNEHDYYHYMLDNIENIKSNLSEYENCFDELKIKSDGSFDGRNKKGKEINENINKLTSIISSYENFNSEIYKLVLERKSEFVKRIAYNRTGFIGIIIYITLLIAAFNSESRSLLFNEDLLKYTTPIGSFISNNYFESSHTASIISSLSLYTFVIQFLFYKATCNSIYKKLGKTPNLEDMSFSKFTTVWSNKLNMEYPLPDYKGITNNK